MGFLRRNFHLITGVVLLILAGGSALALYLDVPAAIKNRQALPAAGPTCAKEDSGCCPKTPRTEAKTLPSGHPPVPGWVIATNQMKAAAP